MRLRCSTINAMCQALSAARLIKAWLDSVVASGLLRQAYARSMRCAPAMHLNGYNCTSVCRRCYAPAPWVLSGAICSTDSPVIADVEPWQGPALTSTAATAARSTVSGRRERRSLVVHSEWAAQLQGQDRCAGSISRMNRASSAGRREPSCNRRVRYVL